MVKAAWTEDLYDVLGVTRVCSPEQIAAASSISHKKDFTLLSCFLFSSLMKGGPEFGMHDQLLCFSLRSWDASIWRFAAACRANMLLKENVAVAIADARLLKDNMC